MCKTNVEGTKCNACKPGFFNLQVGDPNGCQGMTNVSVFNILANLVVPLACTCNVAGTAPGGNSTCNGNDGTCQCKVNVAGGLCDVCKVRH